MRTSTEAHVYMRCHQNAKVKHFDVSNVIYHKFSHGAVSYRLNGENVKVMLELHIYFSADGLDMPRSDCSSSSVLFVYMRIYVGAPIRLCRCISVA